MQDTFSEAHPYTNDELPGRKSDEQLKEDIISNIKKKLGSHPESNISASVFDATVTLSGTVKTYEDRALAGQTAWNTPGVVKVLNELDVSEPDTAGPKGGFKPIICILNWYTLHVN